MANSRLFPSSHWSLIVRAQGQTRDARDALDQLLRRYQRTIDYLLRRCRYPRHLTLEDARQSFLLTVLRYRDIEKLDRNRGRYYPERFDVVSEQAPELELLAVEALDNFHAARERLCEKLGGTHKFEVLQRFIPNARLELEDDAEARRQAARELGYTPGALNVAIFKLRNQLRQHLLQVVADSMNLDVDDPGCKREVELELGLLSRALLDSKPAVAIVGPC